MFTYPNPNDRVVRRVPAEHEKIGGGGKEAKQDTWDPPQKVVIQPFSFEVVEVRIRPPRSREGYSRCATNLARRFENFGVFTDLGLIPTGAENVMKTKWPI